MCMFLWTSKHAGHASRPANMQIESNDEGFSGIEVESFGSKQLQT